MDRDSELRCRVRQRRRDVVAVADVGQRAPVARTPVLADRHHVRQRLTRMFLVAERVDDAQHRCRRGERGQLVVRVGPDDERLDPALEIPRHVLQRLAAAIGKLRRDVERIPAQLAHRNLEGRARPQRRLFEQHPHVGTAERIRGRRMVRQRTLRLQLHGQVEQPREAAGVEIENGEKVFRRRSRCGSRVHVRYSPLIRTYSAVRSHVQMVADSAPDPRLTSI